MSEDTKTPQKSYFNTPATEEAATGYGAGHLPPEGQMIRPKDGFTDVISNERAQKPGQAEAMAQEDLQHPVEETPVSAVETPDIGKWKK